MNAKPLVQKIYAVWTYVSDIEKSKSFYQAVLGVEPRLENNGWVEFNTGETAFALLERPKDKGAAEPRKLRVMLQVADIEQAEQRLRQLGVEVIGKKVEEYGILLTFVDPDGHWLEFYEASLAE
jgi:metallothiol transferase